MRTSLTTTSFFCAAFLLFFCIASCSKSSPHPSPDPTDPCAGKTITVTATPSASTGCTSNGRLLVTASGSNGFTFKVGAAGTYQASASFTNLAAGSYAIFARDAAGCEGSSTVTIAGGTPGPLFNQLKALMSVKCQPCHNNTVQNGGMNWAVDCNIVSNQARIKVRAVDEGTMPAGGPPLTTSERAIITNWITAGGRLTD